MKRLALVILLTLAALAGTPPGYVPSTDTVVASSTVTLTYLHLNNASGSPASCVIKDRSTNCGGGACPLWGPAAVAASGSAGSVVSWPFYSLPATNGFTWSCTVPSAVVGSVSYQ
jgi:hypothetical protein